MSIVSLKEHQNAVIKYIILIRTVVETLDKFNRTECVGSGWENARYSGMQ
jgi:hypothetical protein